MCHRHRHNYDRVLYARPNILLYNSTSGIHNRSINYSHVAQRGDPNGHYVLKRSGNIISQALLAALGFSSLPPSFSLDRCHSRAINDCILLMATAHDADSHIVVLAYGHCYGKSSETWTWFLGQLKDAYPHLNQPHHTLISDRDKGIAHAAEAVFSLVKHLYCTQHSKENLKTRFGQEIARIFLSTWVGMGK